MKNNNIYKRRSYQSTLTDRRIRLGADGRLITCHMNDQQIVKYWMHCVYLTFDKIPDLINGVHVKTHTGPTQHIVCIIDPPVDFLRMFEIQSDAAKTRSNITWYWIHHCSYWGRIQIRVWAHKTHHIARPNGRVMGCLLWWLSTRIDRVI